MNWLVVASCLDQPITLGDVLCIVVGCVVIDLFIHWVRNSH